MADKELSREAARLALAGIEHRITRTRGHYGYLETRVDVLYGGNWLELMRGDQCGQVIGPIVSCDSRMFKCDPVGFYRNECSFGALVTDNAFICLDSVTDG